jgi:hypothetical protein
MTSILTDRFGNPIIQGARVTYPTRRGSTLSVVDGTVIEVRQIGMTKKWNQASKQYVEVPAYVVLIEVLNWEGKPTIRQTFIIERLTVHEVPKQS